LYYTILTQKGIEMSNSNQQQREQLEREIRRNERELRNPYNESKWVEQESIREAREKLDELDRNRRR
jgi:thioester reductase-like protein